MLMDMIAMAAAAIGVAGVLHLLNRISGGRLPRWIMPAGIGAAMLAFTIWNEYSWFPRVQAQLPESFKVASAPADRAFYRPWSYVFPLTQRFVGVDKTGMVLSPQGASVFIADAVVVRRWMPPVRLPVAFDCAKGARADLVDGVG
ncbi:MAG: hypothetical protein WBA91_00265, partial [Paracoccaceae bacterium]